MCVCVCVFVPSVHISAGAHGDQERVLDCLELESQGIVSRPIWVL